MKRRVLALMSLQLLAAAPAEQKPALAPSEIVAAAPAHDWVRIAPADLMVMGLAPDAKGRTRRVVIQLMPAPFSQGWVGNIRKLVAARWYDGVSVNRVQDNYVVQWGDADGEDPKKAKKLPSGLQVMTEAAYTSRLLEWQAQNAKRDADRQTREASIASPPMPIKPPKVEPYPAWQSRDAYAHWVDFYSGWPVATAGYSWEQIWFPIHCYGMVGVGRGLSPDTGSGAELYTVIGHAPRHLDRNIALVGRVVEGIEHLSSLPRGTEALGFYMTAEERTPIQSVRMGNEIKDLPAFEYLSSESPSFAAYADARANRRDAFFNVPAGGADICNIPVPVRRAKG